MVLSELIFQSKMTQAHLKYSKSGAFLCLYSVYKWITKSTPPLINIEVESGVGMIYEILP